MKMLRFRFDEVIGSQLYPEGHPYARSTIGSHETLSNINLEKVQEYIEDNYKPEHTTIVVVGDFDLKETSRLIESGFKGAEELLMAPEDSDRFLSIETQEERDEFLNDWKLRLVDYMFDDYKNSYPARVDCSKRAEPPMPSVSQKWISHVSKV